MKKFNTKHAIKNNFVSTEEREGASCIIQI